MAVSIFQYLNAIQYWNQSAPNILQRVQFPQSVLQNSLLFHPYTIEDGDRPDTIAALYYGDDFYDWIVMLSNQFISVNDNWPLTQDQFNAYIVEKYGSIQTAQQQIDHYAINTAKGSISSVAYDALPANQKRYWSKTSQRGSVYSITPTPASFSLIPNDETVYWTAVTSYDNEFQLNEAKRKIQLIDVRAVASIEQSLRELSGVQ
jgi:hypothetical protein